jgi:glutamine amidotransferase
MIVIIDYGMGNLRSVEKAFHRIGEEVLISSSIKIIENAEKLVLPGVGHFGKGMINLKELNILPVLQNHVLKENIPILGICLGMQLMATHSEEGDAEGLGWFDAVVKKFDVSNTLKFKVPHMGWNTLNNIASHPLMKGISEEDEFYFVHSYHISMNKTSEIMANTHYEYMFTSAIYRDNIFGFQFHPEKSLETGKILLKNFVDL